MDGTVKIMKEFDQYDNPYEKMGAMAYHIQFLREENQQLKSEIEYIMEELKTITQK